MDSPVDGFVDDRFTSVRDTFAELVGSGREAGASVAAYVDGRLVVDLWGGWSDAPRTRAWSRDTLCTTYSVSKPFTALAVLRRVASGALRLDDPLEMTWPEFAAHGKGAATLRHALAHQAGVPALHRDAPVGTLLDEHAFAAAVAATPPEWEPGTAHGEHATTYGALLAEPVRRSTGERLGDILRTEIAGPLGLDVHLGVPATALQRVADVEHADPSWPETVARTPGSLWHRALTRPTGALDVEVVNSAAFRMAQIGAINLHGTARGVAGLDADLLARTPVTIDRALRDEALEPQAVGPDRLLERDVTWTLAGQLDDDGYFGMGGVGGSAGYAHLGRRLAFAYVTRQLAEHDRADAVAEAVEACLG